MQNIERKYLQRTTASNADLAKEKKVIFVRKNKATGKYHF